MLKRIGVHGSADIPDFEVQRTHHALRLTAEFQVTVNAQNGDTFLKSVHAHFQKTDVNSNGSIARNIHQNHRRVASLDLGGNGRIQDALFLFVKADRPPLNGTLTFESRVAVPPGPRPFLQKLELDGDFRIGSATFSNPQLQAKVNELSHRAQGEKNNYEVEPVTSTLKGHVVLRNGIARFSDLSLSIPGASARLS